MLKPTVCILSNNDWTIGQYQIKDGARIGMVSLPETNDKKDATEKKEPTEENKSKRSAPSQIFVHHFSSNGSSKTLDVDLVDPVLYLKRDIETLYDIPVKAQILTFQGKLLSDSASLESYGIAHCSTLFLMVICRGS